MWYALCRGAMTPKGQGSELFSAPRTAFGSAAAAAEHFFYIFVTIQTACAEIPSPHPVKPSFSSVVALTLTRSASILIARARFLLMRSMKGESFGACAMTVASTFDTQYPCTSSRQQTRLSKIRLSAPFYFSSVSGKCLPISPSAAAPRMASAIA